MRSIVALAFLFVAANAMPQRPQITTNELGFPLIPIVRSNQVGPENGAYSFDFESADGTVREESGAPNGPLNTVVNRGSWSFVFPDGTPATFSFVADEGGYRVESDHIPAIPAHALEQIARSERERAAGITHDGQWHPERYN